MALGGNIWLLHSRKPSSVSMFCVHLRPFLALPHWGFSQTRNVFCTSLLATEIVHARKIAVDISRGRGGPPCIPVTLDWQRCFHCNGRHSSYCAHMAEVFPWEFMVSWEKSEVKMNPVPECKPVSVTGFILSNEKGNSIGFVFLI